MSDAADVIAKGGKNAKILGIIAIILGFLAMLAPGLTGVSVAIVVGALAVVAGILRMIWAFSAGSLGKGVLVFVIGVLTLLCGLVLLGNPLFATGVLTLLLAAYFIVDGITELIAGFRVSVGRGWLVFGGIVSILLGILIWAQFPLSGAWAIGILVGVKLLMVGMIMVTAGSAAQSVARG